MVKTKLPSIDCHYPAHNLKDVVLMNGLDLVPDECSEYNDENMDFNYFVSQLKLTHRWCGETKRFITVAEHAKKLKEKLDKELEKLYTELGGES